MKAKESETPDLQVSSFKSRQTSRPSERSDPGTEEQFDPLVIRSHTYPDDMYLLVCTLTFFSFVNCVFFVFTLQKYEYITLQDVK